MTRVFLRYSDGQYFPYLATSDDDQAFEVSDAIWQRWQQHAAESDRWHHFWRTNDPINKED